MRFFEFSGEMLFEKIVGKLAIAYHRTHNIKGTKGIGTTGFKAGEGAMYGKGIYLTYAFDDQQNDRMKELYGPFIIRAKVNLDGMLIFDADVAKVVYGVDSSSIEKKDHWGFLKFQFKKLGLSLEALPEITKHMSVFFDDGDENYRYPEITSVAARVAAAKFHNNPKVKGLVFTGESDGRVIVAYDATKVVPYAWARVIDLNKTLPKVKWNKYEAPPIQKVVPERMPPQDIAFRYFKQKGFTKLQGNTAQSLMGTAAGGYMIGMVNGDYVTLTITNRQANASFGPNADPSKTELTIRANVTREDPLKAKDFNVWMRALSWTLEYHTSPGEAPLAQVYTAIMASHGAMLDRAKANEAFAVAFVKKLVNPGVAVVSNFVKGRDYGKDEIHIKAGPIKIKIESPYDKSCHGDLDIAVVGNIEIRLGFNDGTAREGSASFEKGYETMMNIASMNGRTMVNLIKQHPLSDDLTDKFKNDLMANFDRR